jgi:integrase
MRYNEAMATVIRQPGSRYWIAAFRDAAGKQYRRSTREVDRKRAQAVAEQYERVAKAKGSAQRVRQVIAEFMREHYGQDLPSASAQNYCARWLAARRAETAPGTHRRYGDTVAKFLAHLGPAANRGLDEITSDQIAAFRDAQLAVSAPATANGCMRVVRMVFRAARRDGLLFRDPAEAVRPAKQPPTAGRRPFALPELRAILAVANEEWRSLVKFGLYTGQRLGDIVALTWAQIDLARDEITLTTRKTGKRLVIPIAPALREHLLALPAPDHPRAPVHPRAAGTVQAQQGRVGTLSGQFAELLIAAGLRPPRDHRSRGIGRSGRRTADELSYHSLRHTAVSLLKDAGIPDAVVMALVGHESAAMSHRYTHVGKEALERAAGALPEI